MALAWDPIPGVRALLHAATRCCAVVAWRRNASLPSPVVIALHRRTPQPSRPARISVQYRMGPTPVSVSLSEPFHLSLE
jgi:hypothetical protein